MQINLYSSSAGSGKTFTLAKEYLRVVLPKPYLYKRVLAITFTNAAAAEMKGRIIENLVQLQHHSDSAIAKALLNDGLTENDLKNAPLVLQNILFDYSSFAISTIDSFLHKLIRSFSRELNLPFRFDIVVDQGEVLQQSIGKVLQMASENNNLRELLVRFIREMINMGKSWDISGSLLSLAKEYMGEKAYGSKQLDPDSLMFFMHTLYEIKNHFEEEMHGIGVEGCQIIMKAGLEASDFKQGSRGVASYFSKIQKDVQNYDMNSYTTSALNDTDEWCSKTSPNRETINNLACNELLPLLEKAKNLIDNEGAEYYTALAMLRSIYTYSVLGKVEEVLQEKRDEEQFIFISDFNRIIADQIRQEAVPFIYLRTGMKYKHYFIDEFQDTSGLQWQNLMPLIENSLAEGNFNLLVGDAKQAIYRFRGGDVQLIQEQVHEVDFPYQTQRLNLKRNFRSYTNIISFNNSIFQKLPSLFSVEDYPLLHKVFEDAVQELPPSPKEGGYVQLKVLPAKEKNRKSFIDDAMKEMVSSIKQQLNKGYSKKDITVLVQKNDEGLVVAQSLFAAGIPVISAESLFLKSSNAIQLLVSALKVLNNPTDKLSLSELSYFHKIFHENLQADSLQPGNIDIVPQGFSSRVTYLNSLPLYELVEELIRIFELNKKPDPYLQRFQDLVLEYLQKGRSVLSSFIDYWNERGEKTSIIIPEATDAVRVMTVHKSKGLQFRIVYLPLADWDLSRNLSDYIWAEANESPFDSVGIYPVARSQALEKTIFADDYQKECILNLLDKVNAFYVALTRAVEKMFIFTLEDDSKEKKVEKLSNVLQKLVMENNQKEYELGVDSEKTQLPDSRSEGPVSITMDKYHSYDWRSRIQVRKTGRYKEGVSEERAFGTLVHRVLAELDDLGSLQKLLNSYVQHGEISLDEKERISNLLEAFLNDKTAASWYSGEHKSLSEPQIIAPGGGIHRPDRVVFLPHEIHVIDFKTGQKDAAYHNQLNAYMQLLSDMGHENLKGYLVYLMPFEIVEVKPNYEKAKA